MQSLLSALFGFSSQLVTVCCMGMSLVHYHFLNCFRDSSVRAHKFRKEYENIDPQSVREDYPQYHKIYPQYHKIRHNLLVLRLLNILLTWNIFQVIWINGSNVKCSRSRFKSFQRLYLRRCSRVFDASKFQLISGSTKSLFDKRSRTRITPHNRVAFREGRFSISIQGCLKEMRQPALAG